MKAVTATQLPLSPVMSQVSNSDCFTILEVNDGVVDGVAILGLIDEAGKPVLELAFLVVV
jgi:hypothetical protein